MPSNLPFDRSLLASLIAVGLAGCAATAGTLPAGAPAPATATGTLAAAPAPTAQPTPPGTPKAAPAAAASGPAGAASAPAAPRPPGSPPPFADVTKDAASKEGLLTVWTKDDKTWLEIPKDWIGKPMFLGNSLASGLGEGFVLPGLMGREQVVVLRRAGNNVQLVARSLHARAPAGTPLASALADS